MSAEALELLRALAVDSFEPDDFRAIGNFHTVFCNGPRLVNPLFELNPAAEITLLSVVCASHKFDRIEKLDFFHAELKHRFHDDVGDFASWLAEILLPTAA